MTAIFFDCYGTLFNEGKELIPLIAEKIGKEYDVDSQEIFHSWKHNYLALENNFNKRFMTIIGANNLSLTKTFMEFNLPPKDISKFITILVDKWSNPELYPDVMPVITTLSENYMLGILSNTDNSTIYSAIKKSGLPLSHIVTSEECRIYKPDPAIFDYACDKFQIKKDHLIYVGNSSVDIIGSKRAGLTVIHLNRKNIPSHIGTYAADYIARDMGDLLKIISLLDPLNPSA